MDIYQFLTENNIPYERYDHPPVFTCEEADRLVPELPAAKTKNLFLRDRRGRRHFLVVVGYEKVIDLKGLSPLLGVSKLSLASSERLKRFLGVDPGAVTILGVVICVSRGMRFARSGFQAGNSELRKEVFHVEACVGRNR